MINDKVVTGGPGAVDQETLEKAEAAIAKMNEDFLKAAPEEFVKIQKVDTNLKEARVKDRWVFMTRIYRFSLNMKALIESLGCVLVCKLCDKTSGFIRELETVDDAAVRVLQDYIDTMKLALTERLGGKGGAACEEALKRLGVTSD